MATQNVVLKKVHQGERIDQEEALILLSKGQLHELGAAADSVRHQKHQGGRSLFFDRPQC